MSDRHIETQISESEDLKYIDLASMKIANCVGCFGCWTKTPGKCVIRDDASKVYPYIAKSDSVVYISKIKYGSYDTIMYSQQPCDYFNKSSSNHTELISQMSNYTDILLVFPLYADSLLVGLLNFLKHLEENPPLHKPTISILINCGFLEYEQNDVAIRILKYFCRKNNYHVGSALMLGSCEAILNTPFRFIAKKAIKRLSESVYKQKYREIKATMPLNKWWFKMAANIYWTRYGKKFGITKKEMQTLEIEN